MILSIIIPIYNSAKEIPKALNSILPQLQHISAEILLIDDGSIDDSLQVCQDYAQQYPNIKVIHKQNTGVSDTRNTGICAAQGKYILYLDADDELMVGTISNLITFFELHYWEIDLLTYPIETHYQGRILQPHFRYETLTDSGIFDLAEHPYIGQTTMNIMVKNQFSNNILFDTNMTFMEDQKYCCDVLSKKMKIGFCKQAKYIYHRSDSSSSGHLSGACYIFEQSMNFFEQLFSNYQTIPKAFQGLYINDLAWKMAGEILFPYHYNVAEFKIAQSRIIRLLNQIDNRIILLHPAINYFHKYFFLSLKTVNQLQFSQDKEQFYLSDLEGIVFADHQIEIVVTKLKVVNHKLTFLGFLKSIVFSFTEKPKLWVIENHQKKQLELFESAHSYYICHTKTNQFWGFYYECDLRQINSFSFQIGLEQYEYPASYYFMPKIALNHLLQRYTVCLNQYFIHYENRQFQITPMMGKLSYNRWKSLEIVHKKACELCKSADKLQKKSIWLYYDCKGVLSDNGYLQFIHDFEQDDNVLRYYIIDPNHPNPKRYFKSKHKKFVIPFGSQKHKILFLACQKIITAFIEDINLIPFPHQEHHIYAEYFNFEVIYLQHGVLHAKMPWKYTPEIIMADKIVVSSHYEKEMFLHQHHFRKQDIICSGMPRFEKMSRESLSLNRILFAPSWREYLIGKCVDGIWEQTPEKLQRSDYYQQIQTFLNHPYLQELLERFDYHLDFKIHPIFQNYQSLFHISSNRVHISDHVIRDEDYSIFITDFSSFYFDFVYLRKPILYFLPDEMQFLCGMNGYRELEIPLYDAFGPYANTVEKLLKNLYQLLERNCVVEDIYFKRMETFYFPMNAPTDDIYHHLSQNEESNT